ncbi:hypothetical protein CERSUDRAFT_115442 [Gelatoporia subvermispora B]|uniref:Hydrophobin n=1 Tax=Ceriporiopsis subvermispora (strain B) TaxID=914234 RepID=M2RCC9_CERS8|nr:hypothetical protein CERSUDRAFT_115442 [Gelatoporia subvermispora B]
MFSRVPAFLFFVLSLALLAVASPWGAPTVTVTVTAPGPTETAASVCSTGSAQCCESVQSATSEGIVATLLGLLDIVAGDITGQVGLTCSPITVIGVGSGGECNSNVVCCSDNALGGLISIGCLPITL